MNGAKNPTWDSSVKCQCPRYENYVKYSLETKLFTVIARRQCETWSTGALCFALHNILWYANAFSMSTFFCGWTVVVLWFMGNLIMQRGALCCTIDVLLRAIVTITAARVSKWFAPQTSVWEVNETANSENCFLYRILCVCICQQNHNKLENSTESLHHLCQN